MSVREDIAAIRYTLEDERLHPEVAGTKFGVTGCEACDAISALAKVAEYVKELEGRLKLACEPCAECGHPDWRELDDILESGTLCDPAGVPNSQKEPT